MLTIYHLSLLILLRVFDTFCLLYLCRLCLWVCVCVWVCVERERVCVCVCVCVCEREKAWFLGFFWKARTQWGLSQMGSVPLKTLGTLHGPLNLLLKGQWTLRPEQPESAATVPCVSMEKGVINYSWRERESHPSYTLSEFTQTNFTHPESCMNMLYPADITTKKRYSQMLTWSWFKLVVLLLTSSVFFSNVFPQINIIYENISLSKPLCDSNLNTKGLYLHQ